MTVKGWRVLGTGLVLGFALIGAACGGDDSTAENDDTTTTAPDLSVLGPENAATGEPLKIGYIYAGQAQSIDNTNELTMANATAQYINEYLGGVAGRPLEIVFCEDHLTPAGATDCANQMLADELPVVLAANPANSGPIIDLLEPAGVPFFIQTAGEASVLFSEDASVMGNPTVILAAPIRAAQADGVEKVALVHVDLPAAAQLEILANPMFEEAGLDLVTSAVPLGTPDVTPQIQAAVSDGAEQFVVIGDISLCVTTLKALKTIGFEGTVMSNFNCLTDDAADSIPGGFEGLQVITTHVSDESEEEVQVLNAVAAKYAPGTPTNDEGQSVVGYVTVLGFALAMTDLQPDAATPEGITAALLAMAPQPVPLLPGQTFQCNRTASTIVPAACSNGVAVLTHDADGNVTETDIFDATSFL